MRVGLLATGGVDSTVLAHKLREDGYHVVLIYINYGQTVSEIEVGLLEELSMHLDVELHILTMEFDEGSFGLTDKDFEAVIIHNQDLPEYWDSKEPRYSDTHIEGRNAAMFIKAMAHCSRESISTLYTGMYFCEREWRNVWSRRMLTADNSPGFIHAMNVVAQYGFRRHVLVKAPFMMSSMNKGDIIEMGIKLGVDISNTHSCYFPVPCGKCDNCLSMKKYKKKFNI